MSAIEIQNEGRRISFSSTARYLDAKDRVAKKISKEMAEAFEFAIYSGKFGAPATFASQNKKVIQNSKGEQEIKYVYPTVAQCINEALDSNKLSIADVMSVIVQSARGQIPTESAKNLIQNIVDTYVKENFDGRIEDEDLVSEAC